MPFIDKPTNPEPTPQPPPPSGSRTLDHCLPALVTAWPGTRHIETAPVPQNPLKLLRLANPKPAVPAWPVFFRRTRYKGSCPHVPFAPSAP